MQKLSRILAILGGIVLVIVVTGFIGANLYVQAQATQARIEQELRQRLGVNVQIDQISVTPWAGIVMSGITVPQPPASPNSAPFLKAQRIRLRLRLLSLLKKHLVVKQVSVIDPAVVWCQDAQGKWRLPSEQSPAAVAETVPPSITSPLPSAVPQETPAPEQPPASPAVAEAVKQPEPAREQPLEPQITHVVISGGNFNFIDRSGATVARFEDVSFRSALDHPGGLRGHAHVARMTVRDRVEFSELRTQVLYDDVKLKLTRFGTQIAGGKLEGELEVEPEAAGAPFTTTARFSGVDADDLITAAGGHRGTLRGKLEGSLSAAGHSGQPNELSGNGEIVLHDGQLQQYSFLVALGQVLQIEELTQLHLDQAFAKYHLSANTVAVDQLILRSPNIQLSGKGTIAFDGRMHLDAQLAVNEKVQSRLFKTVRENFHPTNEPGYFAVDFEVNGTIDHPKSNLLEKVVGRDLRDLGSMINSLLGGKSERKKKKAAQNEEQAPPATSPEPATPTPTP